MSNTNNTLTEISALVLAALLIIGGVVLLYVGKIDYSNSVFFFISALGLFGFHSAWKAPSPAQSAMLAQLVSQQQQITTAQIVPQPAPVVQPAPMFTTPVPQPAQFVQPAQPPFQYEASSTYPNMQAMPGQ